METRGVSEMMPPQDTSPDSNVKIETKILGSNVKQYSNAAPPAGDITDSGSSDSTGETSPTGDPDSPVPEEIADLGDPVAIMSAEENRPPLDPPYPFHTRTPCYQPRRILTLDEKLQLIDVFESRVYTIKEIMEQFRCGKTQIYETIRKKQELIDLRSRSADGKLKRVLRVCANEEINNRVYGWYMEAKSQDLPITGPALQTVAKAIAERAGNQGFKASNGWLNSFRRRYSVQLSKSYGRQKGVSEADSALVDAGEQETGAECPSRLGFRCDPLVPLVEMRVYDDVGFGKLRPKETDENVLQSLPDLGIVKSEPLDPHDSEAGPSTSFSYLHENPPTESVPAGLSVPSAILPDLPSTHILEHSVALPSSHTVPTTSQESLTASKVTPAIGRKRRQSKDGDEPKRFCNGCGGIRDEFSVFGEFVAGKLRSLKSRANKVLAQDSIKKLLIEVEMKDFEEESEAFSVSSTV